MAINFSIGEYIIINRAYVEKILGTTACGCTTQTLASLSYIGANPSEVTAADSIYSDGTLKSFIRVLPSNIKMQC
jgi:hypothetical protein